MLGTFTEKSLDQYQRMVAEEYREKKQKALNKQGCEQLDNLGVGSNDKSFEETGESQDPDDYAEFYDYGTCLRPDGSLYGISRGKCRQGNSIDRETANALSKSAGIQKRGQKAITQARAEKVLKDLQKEGGRDRKATERREKAGGGNREEQVRQLAGKAWQAKEKLQARAKKMKEGPQKEKVLAKVERLTNLRNRLLKEQKRLRDQASKGKSEGFGRIPAIYETGRGLA